MLGLPDGERLTQRFKESVITLLGNVPRLDSWLHQFYTARSKIVHTGSWSHHLFYPVDATRAKAILGGKTTEQPYRPLTAYGRRIFRLCLGTLLAGATLAEDSNLRALFEHNQERLERICLTFDDTSKDVADRFAHAAEDILQLDYHPVDAAGLVSPDTALAAGRRAAQAFLDLGLELPDPVRDLVEEIISQQGSSMSEQPERYEQLADLIPRHWGIIADPYTLQDLDVEAPSILLHMAKYLSSLQHWNVWRKLDA